MNQLQLDQIVGRIDDAFGDELPFSDRTLTTQDRDLLLQVFGDGGYQDYLHDQVNRQIIRDYLTNAVMLGFLPEQQLAGVERLVASVEGRASLSLHMLMNSVEQAAELLAEPKPECLKKLKSGVDLPPYIKLIRS